MEEAPFDRIILTAAPPEVPQVLVVEGKIGRSSKGAVAFVPIQRSDK